jgi:hypothetical protein
LPRNDSIGSIREGADGSQLMESVGATSALKCFIRDEPFSPELGVAPVRLYNKLEDSYHLHNKKALLYNMKTYYELIGQDPF